MLACYTILLLLIIVTFIFVIAGLFSIVEACVLIPIILFALFSVVYDLLEYREELFLMQEIFVKHLLRIGKRFRVWKDDRFD
jgi:hypothetical protein